MPSVSRPEPRARRRRQGAGVGPGRGLAAAPSGPVGPGAMSGPGYIPGISTQADLPPDLASDLELAHSLADAADAISMARFRAADLVVETKPDLTPVTEADRAVEEMIRARLADARPDDGILGEEFGGELTAGGGSERRWIIDPIDGTKGYARGIPVWATLIALEVDGDLVAGVVSAPALGSRWSGARGPGRARATATP